ncbi:MAG: TM2 domain-containing protein [Polyangiaceae bacterium]|nr:TM2 domain-containing protein [Polyangiaceae bacterium]
MQGHPPGGWGPPPGPPGYGPPGHAPGYGPPPGPQPFAPPPVFHGYDPRAPWGVDPKTGRPYSDKQKIIAGILQIFLGKFGVGRFYTGHTNLAVIQLITCMLGVWVFSWFTCGMTVLVLFWPVIDGIIILATDSTDANGLPLR